MRKSYLLYQNRSGQIWQTPFAKLVEGKKCQTVSDKSKSVCVSGISQMSSGKLSKPAFSLSWSQYVFLIGIKDGDARSFYEIEAASNSWTLPELTSQFNSGLREALVEITLPKDANIHAKEYRLYLSGNYGVSP